MTQDPPRKQAVAFIDGSNTRLAARKAFGEGYATFNPLALAEAVCDQHHYELAGVHFYLGVPDLRVTEDGHYAWMKRCARWRRQGVDVFTRVLRQDEDGTAREKGIDVRLALDAVAELRRHPYDVALLFSQDQDFAELATELKRIAVEDKREIEIASVFPSSERVPAATGIRGTQALPLDKALFAGVLDDAENRKRRFGTPEADGSVNPSAPGSILEDGTQLDDEAALEAAPTRLNTPAATAHSLSVVARSQAPSAPRRGILRWAGLAVGLYLLGAAATFGVLVWQTRAAVFAPLTTTADGVARAESLLDLGGRALLWPKTWIAGDRYRELSSAVDRIDLKPIQSYANQVIARIHP